MNVTRDETYIHRDIFVQFKCYTQYSVLDIFYILEYHARYVYFSIFQFLIKAFILIHYNNQYF